MDEADFLERYDPDAFERPSVAVDLVLMSVADAAPCVLLMRRDTHPFRGAWALPGGFVDIDESIDGAARRVLQEKAHIDDAYVEQLYTFGDVGRDPRTRVISVAYFALLRPERFAEALRRAPGLRLADIRLNGGAAHCSAGGEALPLAFDHGEILALALERLRGKLDYSEIAFALLPELFTLRQLQAVHEAILGTTLNKPAFRRRMLDRGWLEPTGARESGASYRPAELFRFRKPG